MKCALPVLLGLLLCGGGAVAGGQGVAWRQGELQIHFIYTGVGEQAFYVFPDGTTMLLDCGDCYDATREPAPVPAGVRGRAGAFVADYVRRVNPAKDPSRVDYLMLSHYHRDHTAGLPQAIETLHFAKAFDRTYPDMDFPCRLADYMPGDLGIMTNVYATLRRRDGTVVEKWRVGERDQLRLLHGGADGFSVFNLCANGFVADEKTGEVVDCYKDYPDKQPGFKGRQWINENGMSVGFVLRYGDFSFYTAGDFSDRAVMPEGVARFQIEDVLAEHVGPVTVAKLNHHGYQAMTEKLVRALSPKAWVNCVWNHRQNTPDTMTRILGRGLQANAPAFYPTFLSPSRPCAGVASAAYEGRTFVLTVTAGGRTYDFRYMQDNSTKDKSR